ncbi:imelysin family protein [Pseudoalteromonas shioyasakiensis]|uniref:imelysin family protein n=1 Tax=Pseudoalteromonas shioyasakiensis TaxID=1190813 RepID=UPI0021193158|nr:imelysin family protein [Pseudoalteromonas shioyasakiensis]MCQ8876932.1 imelysin family protein [Pseudoalteromonas shioyasakiensis]
MYKANFSKIALSIAVAIAITACGESTSSSQGAGFNDTSNEVTQPSTGSDFDEAQLVANLVDNVISKTFELFQNKAQSQQQAISEYCHLEQQSVQSSSEQAIAALGQAQSAWLDTMASWQQAEMMQVGPLVTNNGELKSRIYSWPSISRCGIDQDVVYHQDNMINQDASRPYDITARTATRRGMFALQHVLFNQQFDHHCSVTNDALANWNSRTIHERKIARCEFAVTAATDVINSSAELLDKWQGDNGFAMQLKTAGQAGSQFDSPHVALNHISDALFYLTEVVKDKKIAEPIGIFPNSCGTSACPEDVESLDAKSSLANIKANIIAFEAVLLGQLEDQEALIGFDDYLTDEQATDTLERMLTGIAASKAAIAAIETDLGTALINNEEQVRDIHTQVKTITDELKNDFINELALELPKTSAGDND